MRVLNEVVLGRAQQAQVDLHGRVMLRQIAHDEYVPAASPLDVEAKLRAEFTDVCVHAFEIPDQLLLDWTLLQYGVSNAVSNARKYGAPGVIEIVVQHCNPISRSERARGPRTSLLHRKSCQKEPHLSGWMPSAK